MFRCRSFVQSPAAITALIVSSFALAIALSARALADEGMWTFDNFPSAKVKSEYGVDVDRAWLEHVQHSAVRLTSGCSASLVTKDGLVLTNNHCVAECDQNLSTPGHDLFKNGYSAATREEEKSCPGVQAEVLMTISDVTSRVTGTGANLAGADLVAARNAVIATIEKEGCPDATTMRCQVVDLYHAASSSFTNFANMRMSGSYSRPASLPASSEAIPTTFTFRATTSIAPFCVFTRTGKPSRLRNI